MNMNRTPILVGERVVAIPPSRYAGLSGRVIDFTNVGRGFLVDLDGDMGERWLEVEILVRLDDTWPMTADVAEPEGQDAELDAIEAALAVPTFDAQRAIAELQHRGDYRMHMAGAVAAGRASLVESSANGRVRS